jgi:ComF family protein
MRRVNGFLLDLLTSAIGVALPEACLLCGARGSTLCPPCLRDAFESGPGCRLCAAPLPADARAIACGRCLKQRPAFDATIAAALFRPPYDQLVRGLKYGAQLHHAPTLAALLVLRVRQVAATASIADVLVPVPLSRERLAERGFNQSIEIARPLSRTLGLALDTTTVLRLHDTAPQASLRFEARRTNMRGAFVIALGREDVLRGRRVAIVDDVMTTGATLDALARALKRAGAARVVNLVAARTP